MWTARVGRRSAPKPVFRVRIHAPIECAVASAINDPRNIGSMIGAREFTAFTAVGTTAAGLNVGVVAGACRSACRRWWPTSSGSWSRSSSALSVTRGGRLRPAGRPVGLALRRFARYRSRVSAQRSLLRRAPSSGQSSTIAWRCRCNRKPWPREAAGEQTLGVRVRASLTVVRGAAGLRSGRSVAGSLRGSAGRPPCLRDRFSRSQRSNSTKTESE